MSKILSLVIPTYNMEKYLGRCLDSLIIDEDAMKMLEVIVVNDGSKDASSTIAHEYESKYPQTFRIIDKENGNYGSCVNRGLKEATGKYFRILDADDRFNTEALAALVDKLSKLDVNVDLVLTCFSIIDMNENTTTTRSFKSDCVFEKIYNLPQMDIDDFPLPKLYMHQMTYRTEILRKSGLHHDEGISYTDTEYVYVPLQCVNNVIAYNLNLYQYYVGREGQTVDSDSYKKHIGDLYQVFDTLSNIHFNNIESRNPNTLYLQRRIMSPLICLIIRIVLTKMNGEEIKTNKDRLNAIISSTKSNDPILYRMVKNGFKNMPVLWLWEKLGVTFPFCYKVILYIKSKMA